MHGNLKVLYLGFDIFSCALEQLVDNRFDVVKIYTCDVDNEYDFNTRTYEIANSYGIPIESKKINDTDLRKDTELEFDIILSAGYGYKIPDWKRYCPYAVNFHPTLLPEGRGAWPLPWIILKNLRQSGITFHEINENWDSGCIVAQNSFEVSDNEDLDSLTKKCQEALRDNILNIMNNIEDLWNNRKEQESGSYWNFPRDADRTLNFSKGCLDILRTFRAFKGFESFFYLDNEKFFARSIDINLQKHYYNAGSVLERSEDRITVACRDGLVEINDFVKAFW